MSYDDPDVVPTWRRHSPLRSIAMIGGGGLFAFNGIMTALNAGFYRDNDTLMAMAAVKGLAGVAMIALGAYRLLASRTVDYAALAEDDDDAL